MAFYHVFVYILLTLSSTYGDTLPTAPPLSPTYGDTLPTYNTTYNNGTVLFRDDFLGNVLNTSSWSIVLGDGTSYINITLPSSGPWGNWERECYVRRLCDYSVQRLDDHRRDAAVHGQLLQPRHAGVAVGL